MLVGLSGGPDSLCLFHALLGMRETFGITLSAVHVNHMLRAEADSDQRFVETFCRTWGISCRSVRADVTALAKRLKQTPEEAGRTLRYQAFDEAAKEIFAEMGAPVSAAPGEGTGGPVSMAPGEGTDAPVSAAPEEGPGDPVSIMPRQEQDSGSFTGEAGALTCSPPPGFNICIALAHNRDDQAETLLLRILRGAGPNGLAGIPLIRKSEGGFSIIRPLLTVSRREIEDYCGRHKLQPRQDQTNEKPSYRRNSLRLELLPLIREKYNPAVENALVRLANIAAEDRDYFDGVVGSFLKNEQAYGDGQPGKRRIRRDRAAALHPSILSRLILHVFAEEGLIQDIEAVHIAAAIRLIRAGGTGKRIEFPGGYLLRISYEWVIFERTPDTPEQSSDVSAPSPELADPRAVPVSAILTGQILFGGSRSPMLAEILDPETAREASGSSTDRARREASDSSTDRARREASGSSRARATLDMDYDLLLSETATLILRTRRPGDRMRPEGMAGRRKIQDIFVDMKIPGEERDSISILATQSKILWIPGIRKSGEFHPSAATKRLLRLTLQTVR